MFLAHEIGDSQITVAFNGKVISQPETFKYKPKSNTNPSQQNNGNNIQNASETESMKQSQPSPGTCEDLIQIINEDSGGLLVNMEDETTANLKDELELDDLDPIKEKIALIQKMEVLLTLFNSDKPAALKIETSVMENTLNNLLIQITNNGKNNHQVVGSSTGQQLGNCQINNQKMPSETGEMLNATLNFIR